MISASTISSKIHTQFFFYSTLRLEWEGLFSLHICHSPPIVVVVIHLIFGLSKSLLLVICREAMTLSGAESHNKLPEYALAARSVVR